MEALPYLALVCIWGWSQSFPPVGGCVHESHRFCKSTCVHVLGQPYGYLWLVLVELWVWGESI